MAAFDPTVISFLNTWHVSSLYFVTQSERDWLPIIILDASPRRMGWCWCGGTLDRTLITSKHVPPTEPHTYPPGGAVYHGRTFPVPGELVGESMIRISPGDEWPPNDGCVSVSGPDEQIFREEQLSEVEAFPVGNVLRHALTTRIIDVVEVIQLCSGMMRALTDCTDCDLFSSQNMSWAHLQGLFVC